MIRKVVRHPLTNVTIFAKETPAGIVICGISFGVRKTLDGAPAVESNHPVLRSYAKAVAGFLSGTVTTLADIPIDLGGATPFTKAVLASCKRIPRGSTVSYSRLAHMAGYLRAVRAAASVMRNNRFPLVVPCHRVIAKNGGLGGFMGATRGTAIALKRALLELEGVGAFAGAGMPQAAGNPEPYPRFTISFR